MKLNTIKRTLAVVLSAAAILTGTMGNTFHTSAAGEGNGGLTLLRGFCPWLLRPASPAADGTSHRTIW